MDSTRIGVWGWSGGGSMTLNAMFRYPELYQTGMSVAPVPDQRLYDTIYQERYMGLPQENEARVSRRLADHLRRPACAATCSWCTAPATTTCTTRAPSGW